MPSIFDEIKIPIAKTHYDQLQILDRVSFDKYKKKAIQETGISKTHARPS